MSPPTLAAMDDAASFAATAKDETYALPLEDARARAAYGQSSAVNKLLIINAEPSPSRTTVVLVRQAIGY